MTIVVTSSADRRARARALRRGPDRMSCREIAGLLGVSRSTVHAYTRDLTPDVRRRRRWTRESLVEWVHAFAAEHGRPPCAREVTPPPRGSGWPSISAVIAECGSWNELIVAAGFEPRPAGYARRRR